MYKYLEKSLTRLKKIKSGIAANIAAWSGQLVTAEIIQADINEIEAMDNDVTNAEQQLTQKQKLARQLADSKMEKADSLELKIKGIHSEQKEKWIEYGIEPEKTRTQRSVPELQLNLLISDDTDGEGFQLQVEKRDPAADIYIWEKGVGASAEDTGATPALVQFTETTKSYLVDDDVVKGKRYYYRVRAYNSKGYGPWSNVVSRVQ